MAVAEDEMSTALMVAAIDIGSSYSGYAFSTIRDDLLKIYTNPWVSIGSISLKTSTSLLLNPDKSFNSFGYEARNNFEDLKCDGEHLDYYFFHHFKNFSRHTNVVGDNRTLPAIEVFSHSIRYLKKKVMENITKTNAEIRDRDIKFVLTVPALWDAKERQFMRDAAKNGGIKETQLSIVSEPEAAYIYCQHLPGGSKAGSRTKHMVVDIGTFTDITVLQRQRDETLGKLLVTGNGFGWRSVHDAFTFFLAEIIGKDTMAILQKDYMDDFIKHFLKFELRKRAMSDRPSKVAIEVPPYLDDIIKEGNTKKTMKDVINSSPYGDEVSWGRQKILISIKQFRKLFKPTIDGIIELIGGILNKEMFHDVEDILIVGDFAECNLVQNAIGETFGEKRIIIPDDASQAVLKGAVISGRITRPISNRVARHTYGIQNWPGFEPRRHPLEKLVVVNGVVRCKDTFFKFIEIGQHVSIGHVESQVIQALKPDKATLQCTVYVSSQRDPDFVDDEGCTRLGFFTVPLNQRGPVEIKVTVIFEDTQLRVQAKVMATGSIYEGLFDYLNGEI